MDKVDKTNASGETPVAKQFAIASADEGVRLSGATRLGFVGALYRLASMDEVVAALKKTFGMELNIFASEENSWVKTVMELHDWDSANACMEQQIAALAERSGLAYLGLIAFVDPVDFGHGIKAHMVRPHGIHVAKRVCLTIGGGEQVFNLGNFVLSADWVHAVKPELAKAVLQSQIDFCQTLVKKPLEIVIEEGGVLSDELKAKNKAVLEKLGLVKAA